MNDHTCQETNAFIAGDYIRCGRPAKTLVKHRGRDEGPYWMCDECAYHNIRNRNGEDVTPEELKQQRSKVEVRFGPRFHPGYMIREDFLPEVYALLSRLEKQS